MGITPRELTELLGISERTQTNWRAERWIPGLSRGTRPATGRIPHYEWADREIIAQAATLEYGLSERGRMETAGIFAWFAGFEVPRKDIRDRWVAFETLMWKRPLKWALAGEAWPGDTEAVTAAVRGERHRQHKKKHGYSDERVEFTIRMWGDPAFDLRTYLGQDAPAAVKATIAEFADSFDLPADAVQGLAAAIQDYWSAPRQIAVIHGIPGEMLTQAHDDVRVLLGPYRAWLELEVSKWADDRITDLEEELLELGLSVAARVGRWLMKLDIALRRLGCGPEVDATIAMLRDLAARDEIREAVNLLRRDWQTIFLSAPDTLKDPDAFCDEFARDHDPCFDRAWGILQAVGLALRNLWLPRLKLALAEAAGHGDDRC